MSRPLRPSEPCRRRTVARLIAATLVASSASLVVLPSAYADSQSTLTPTAEGWYQPNPSCATPAGCSPAGPPPSSPYPAGTLHVGLSAGQETARSYLALPFATFTEMITAGTLTVPLDTAQADGSSSPETAKVQVCLTSATITAVEGSFDPPPKVDCAASVPAAYIALPQPTCKPTSVRWCRSCPRRPVWSCFPTPRRLLRPTPGGWCSPRTRAPTLPRPHQPWQCSASRTRPSSKAPTNSRS